MRFPSKGVVRSLRLSSHPIHTFIVLTFENFSLFSKFQYSQGSSSFLRFHVTNTCECFSNACFFVSSLGMISVISSELSDAIRSRLEFMIAVALPHSLWTNRSFRKFSSSVPRSFTIHIVQPSKRILDITR